MITENIIKTYEKNANKTYSKINMEAKATANNYEIAERVHCFYW